MTFFILIEINAVFFVENYGRIDLIKKLVLVLYNTVVENGRGKVDEALIKVVLSLQYKNIFFFFQHAFGVCRATFGKLPKKVL